MNFDLNMFGIFAAALAVLLALIPYDAPKKKRVSKRFYFLAWCAVGGTLLAFKAETDMAFIGGFLFICIGYFGLLYHFAKGGTVYVTN